MKTTRKPNLDAWRQGVSRMAQQRSAGVPRVLLIGVGVACIAAVVTVGVLKRRRA